MVGLHKLHLLLIASHTVVCRKANYDWTVWARTRRRSEASIFIFCLISLSNLYLLLFSILSLVFACNQNSLLCFESPRLLAPHTNKGTSVVPWKTHLEVPTKASWKECLFFTINLCKHVPTTISVANQMSSRLAKPMTPPSWCWRSW